MPAEASNAMRCAKHDVETFLRCGKCDKPICPDCLVVSPAGTRCRECASLKSSPLFQVPVDRLALGLVVGLTVGTLGGYVLASASGFGFLLLWAGLFYGGLVGEAVLRTVYRKRGIKVEAVSGACALLGAVMGFLGWMQSHSLPLSSAVMFIQLHPFYIAAVAIAVFAAVSRVRFI